MYGVCLLNFRKISIKREQLQIEVRLFLAFFSLGPGNVDIFFAALELLLEHLSEVAAAPFFVPPPAPTGSHPDFG
jgi:hypothetical protein